ncbi:MAG: aminotransferase class IV [Acidimicrobiia bacterium]|nr:aminotransferase class IV [Acidimicrobiia bacterium]
MAHGTHDHDHDPRNDEVLIRINDDLVPRARAVVSVFDSGFLLGDGVWEGLRIVHGRPLFLDQHLDRLFEGAAAIDLDIGRSRDELAAMLADTLAANGMNDASAADDAVHVRLMITRGTKSTPYQDPRFTVGPPTIVIVCEYKAPAERTVTDGIRLFTVHVRRGRPDVQDPGLNTHSKHNCISACIQAAKAGADEALMLDPHGFVATCNSTHFFIVRNGEVWTSTGDYCLAGITRANVLDLCAEHGLVARERNFSLAHVYGADEAFVTGTFAGVAPVTEVDGRVVGDGRRGPMTERLQSLYRQLVERDVAAASTPPR